ncbi:hypothetical protein BMMON2_25610 [Burkholderia mallei]
MLLYGLPGFGYIITATFLPVIARAALPAHSRWPDLFWPMFGAALIAGALLGARLPSRWDNRLLLAACCAVQALGVALGIVWPTAPGFALGSALVGLPFTAITLFAMREARRLRGERAAGLMGYATASYGVGQIAGPLAAAPFAAHAGSFSPALWLAATMLAVGRPDSRPLRCAHGARGRAAAESGKPPAGLEAWRGAAAATRRRAAAAARVREARRRLRAISAAFGPHSEHSPNTFGERSSRAATGAHFVKARTSVRRALCNNRFISAC